jgi:hypothetical protein
MTSNVEAQLRRIEDTIDSGDGSRILAAVSEFIAINEAEAPLFAWAWLIHRREPYVYRVISYSLAKGAASQNRFLWAPLAAVVAIPTDDAATMTNISSAIQIYDEYDGILTAVLAPHFGAFTLRGLRGAPMVADAVGSLLIRLATRGALEHLLTRTQAAAIRELLTETSDSLGHRPTLFAILHETPFPEVVPDATQVLSRYEASVAGGRAAETMGERVATSLLSILANARSSYELRRQAEELNAVAEEIRLEGSDAEKGRLGVGTFERLIHSWTATIHEGIASLNPLIADSATMFVPAPARGSFVLRFLVQSPEPELVTRSFDRLAVLTQRPEDVSSDTTLTPEGRTQLLQFLNVLAQEGLDATMSITDARTFTTPKRRLVAATLNSQLRELRRRNDDMSIPLRVPTGVLEAANDRQESFEVIADDFEDTRGDVPPPRRPVILPKIVEAEAKALSSGDVPQQGSLDRIVHVIRVIASGAELAPKQLAMANSKSSLRDLDYIRHSAKVLGLLTDEGSLTSAGSALSQLPDSRVLDFLSLQFELSTVGRLWKKWSRANDLHALDPDTAPRFLRQHGLSDAMAERRGRTLGKWLHQFKARSIFEE